MYEESIQQVAIKLQELKNKAIKKGLKEGNLGDLNIFYTQELYKIGLENLKDIYESIEEEIFVKNKKSKKYQVIKKDKKTLITSLGSITFTRRLYKDRDGESVYLFDRLIELRKGIRVAVDAVAKIFEETIETSYRKGGKNASVSDSVTKQTVMNLLKQTVVPKRNYVIFEKKKVDYLYIDADEDHVALQREYELNAMNKLIYVYEGIEPVAPKSERKRLINPHYFGHIDTKSTDNIRLWAEVRDYIEEAYDVKSIKKIYLNGDGGAWIKEGLNMFKNMTFVMDKFHITEYVNRMTNHLEDSQDEAKSELYRLIYNHDRNAYDEFIGRLYMTSKNDTTEKNITDGDIYFRHNFDSICLRFSGDEHVIGCSAEGHVSHVLASRMSSRPMGWTIEGANKITQLRLFKLNGGDIYTLVKANDKCIQRMQIIKSEHEDDRVYSAKVIIDDEHAKSDPRLKYIEHYQVTITNHGKTMMAIHHINY